MIFSEYAVASMFRLTENRYDKVYEGTIDPSVDSLDKIYYQFNVNHPKDFRGHSLSVSDVVVLNQDEKRIGWYCDSFGFQELKDFCKTAYTTETKGRCR